MPGEDVYSWSTTAATNANSDSLINWAEGQARASVNDSERSEMAAHAKKRNLENGSIVTTGTANTQAFSSGVGYTGAPPTGLRVLIKIGEGLTNNGATTLNMDGTGNNPVVRQNGGALSGAELRAGGYADLTFDGTNWVLLRETATGFNEPPPLPSNGGGGGTLPPSATATPAGPDLLSTTTAADSATITIGGFDTTYDEYRLVITNLTAKTNNTQLALRAAVGSSPVFISGASDYSWASFLFTSVPSTVAGGDFNDNEIELTGATVSNLPGFPLVGEIRIYAPGASDSCNIQWAASYQNGNQTAYFRYDGGGRVNPALPVTAIQLYMAPVSGTNTILTGTFQLYGLRN